jgi:hypothetical protein
MIDEEDTCTSDEHVYNEASERLVEHLPNLELLPIMSPLGFPGKSQAGLESKAGSLKWGLS